METSKLMQLKTNSKDPKVPDGDISPDRSPQIPTRTLPSTFIQAYLRYRTNDAIK